MTYSVYDKPYKNYPLLVDHLEVKGLSVTNRSVAESTLRNINYYRFKVYLRPFLDVSTNTFHPGSTFEQGLDLYRFDDELRDLLFTVVGRLEVKLRSRLDQVVSEHINDPFWYLQDSVFNGRKMGKIHGVRGKINNAFQSSRDDFTNHFKTKYVNIINSSYKHLPPFWLAAELTTFGHILALFDSLEKPRFNVRGSTNKLDDLANEFGAGNLQTLNSWLLGVRDIRNRCAHHSRLWNSNFRAPRGGNNLLDPSLPTPNTNRIYLILMTIHIMCKNIGVDISLSTQLGDLIRKHPAVDRYLPSMGFPNNWHTDPAWL